MCLFVDIQSQKTQGFYVADFATLSDERRSLSKIFLLFIWIKEHCVRKFEGLARSKLLGISQTDIDVKGQEIEGTYSERLYSFQGCRIREEKETLR